MSPYPHEPNPWQPSSEEEPPHRNPASPDPDAVPEPIEYPVGFEPRAEFGADHGSPVPQSTSPPPGPYPSPKKLSQVQLLRTFLAWTVILGCTIALVFIQHSGMEELAQQAEDDTRPGFSALYIARYAVGMEQVFKGQGGQLLPQYDAIALESTHQDAAMLRGVILAGELQGRSAAIERLGPTSVTSPREYDMATGDDPIAGGLIHRIYTDQDFVPNAAQRQELIDNHGWFGELAVGYNLPVNDPTRLAPRESGKWMVIGLLSVFVVIGLALLLGFALLITLVILLTAGVQKIQLPTGPTNHRVAYLELVAVFLLLFIVLNLALGLIGHYLGMDLTLAFLLLSPLALLWPRIVGVSWKQFRADMGYHRGRGWVREIGSGIGGYLAGLPVIAVGIGITFILSLFSGATADHPIGHELSGGNPFQILLVLGAAVIWAPLVEESVFRSAFYRHLRQLRGVPGWLLATLVTSFIFAVIHPQGWIGVPALMSIAFVLAGLREWRGSIIPSMTAHALHNGIVTLVLGIILFA